MGIDKLDLRVILEWGIEKMEGILECIGAGQFQNNQGVIQLMTRKKGVNPDARIGPQIQI
jgi:hypothetical protein